MRIGICFGCYSPLHQGHLDLIMRAKKENDVCVVFVCGYDDDPRGNLLNLDKRYRIISNYLKDENMYFGKINDTELGLDESMSASNWKIWLEEAYTQLGKMSFMDELDENKLNIINWYVAEESYSNHITDFYDEGLYDSEDVEDTLYDIDVVNCIVADRNLNPVSGTLCRTHPLQYWNKITAPFRAYYSHNILITGTASEGKSTLVRDIGRYFGLPYSYEKGRDNCKIKTEPEFSVKDYIYNLYEQRKLNESLICSPQNPGVFVSDTDNIVTLMYAFAHKGREGFVLSEEDYTILYDIAKVYAKTTKWDKIFLIEPSRKPIVDDGERYMPDSNYQIRLRYYKFLKSLYDEFGYQYEILDGDYYDNFLRVKEYINGLYEV